MENGEAHTGKWDGFFFSSSSSFTDQLKVRKDKRVFSTAGFILGEQKLAHSLKAACIKRSEMK